MTYLQFLLVFVAAPTLVLAALIVRAGVRKRWFLYVAGLAVVALLYATPWDNYLVWKEIWYYGPDRVIGTIGYVPVEEYMFFMVQTIFTGLWTLFVVLRWIPPRHAELRTARRPYLEGVLYVLYFFVGVAAFTTEAGTYFALIAVWSAPICAFQWFWSPRYLAANRRLLAAAILPPSVYLAVADWYAIRSGIWYITDTTRTRIELGGLPFEEALFFTVTNVMVVQGLVLLLEYERRKQS